MLGNRRRPGGLLFLLLLLALGVGLGCRKELPELFDRNEAPETYITSAPVESLFDGFRVRLNWYGRDPDGEIAYYLWAWTDSSRAYFAAWNPETNANDRILQDGVFDATHLTTRTDSVFTLLANDNGGTSRDLTFSVTAVDDKGRRDPVPARLYFTASVDSRPQIIWVEEPPETLSVGESFQVTFTGSTANDSLLGYQWASGNDPSFEPRNNNGDPIWTYQITEDNTPPDYAFYQNADSIMLEFDNDPMDPEIQAIYKFGRFQVKAKCIDLAGVESEINANTNPPRGVVTPILNRDPNTRLRPEQGSNYPIVVSYIPSEGAPVETIVITPDSVPTAPGEYSYVVNDTIPWGEDTWIELNLQGWDEDNPVIAADEGIDTRFQLNYSWSTPSLNNFNLVINADSQGRYPPSDSPLSLGFPEDIQSDFVYPIFGPAGNHFRMNAAPLNYRIRGYAIDHFGRVDGRPLAVDLTAGFASFVDSVELSSLTQTFPTGKVEIMNRPPGRLNLNLMAWPANNWPEAARFNWDEGTDTASIYPYIVESQDNVLFCEYDLMLTVFAHDDPRNGVAAQLGRVWWNLLDGDFQNNSIQFVDERFFIAQGGFITVWWEVFPDDTSPPASGSYRIRMRVRAAFADMNVPDNTPDYLGEKTLVVRTTNTIQSQSFQEKIEDQEQRSMNFVTIGRISNPRERDLDIVYVPWTP